MTPNTFQASVTINNARAKATVINESQEMTKCSDKWQTNIKWLCDQHPIYHNKRSITNGIWYKSLFDCVCVCFSFLFAHPSWLGFWIYVKMWMWARMREGDAIRFSATKAHQIAIDILSTRTPSNKSHEITHSPNKQNEIKKIVSVKTKHICIGDFTPLCVK